MRALGLDFGVELEQPALEDGCCVALRLIENRENVVELQACIAVCTDLLQASYIALAVPAVVVCRAARGLEQAGGFVIEQGAAAEAAALRNCRNRQRHGSTMNPKAIDGSTKKAANVVID